jgi:mono/diheme cytochrome c family protein
MTEVPEHLLRRSRERREALGLLPGGGGDTPTAPAGEAEAPAAEAEVEAPAAAAPAPAPAAPPPVPVEEPPRPVPAHVAAALSRPKIPTWAVPVLAALPFWAIIYAGTLTVPDAADADPVLSEGRTLYEDKCAGCHGGEGGGGVGRPLDGGEVLLTFPEPEDHLAWVTNGSPEAGTPYGDPERPGGQRVSQSEGFGAMPAFGPEGTDPLTEEEIVAVVRYEREILSGETESALAAQQGEGTEAGNEAESEGGDTGGGGDAGGAG